MQRPHSPPPTHVTADTPCNSRPKSTIGRPPNPGRLTLPRRAARPEGRTAAGRDASSLAVQLLVAGILAGGASTASAQSNADLLQEILALKSRLQELEQKVAAPPPSSPAVPAVPEGASKLSENVQWSEFVAGKSRFKIYGFLRADAIFDDSRPGAGANSANATLIPAYILNENPAAVAGLATGGNNAVNNAPTANARDFTVHPRLTRLGLDFTGPEIESLWGAKTGGKLEIDFYNLPAGAAESREFPRLRHAYLSLLAGQTSDLISPSPPVVNPDFVMWGAGNLGDRRPQFRLAYTPQLGAGTLFTQSLVGMTGADDNLSGGGLRAGEASALPLRVGHGGTGLQLLEERAQGGVIGVAGVLLGLGHALHAGLRGDVGGIRGVPSGLGGEDGRQCRVGDTEGELVGEDVADGLTLKRVKISVGGWDVVGHSFNG